MPSLNTKLASAPNTTSGYVLRATSSTTIGNSTIQDDGTNVAIGTTPGTYKLNVSGTGNFTGALSGTSATFSGDLTIDTNTLYVDSTNNRVGIGRTDPTRLLDVSAAGAAYIRTSDRTNSVNVDMYSASSGGGIGTQTNHDFILQTNNTQRLLIAASTGAATFSSANQALGGSYSTTGNVLISTTDSFAINKGGSLSLGGKYNTAGAPIETFARIHGKKENSNDGDTAGYLAFETVPDATALLTERMRITSVGNVGIGTNVPSTKLEVNGFGTANSIMTYPCAKFYGGGSGGINIGTDGTYAMIATDTSGADMQLLTRVAGVFYPRMTITSGGNVLIGTTSDDARLTVQPSGSGYGQVINHTNAGSQFFISFRYNGSQIGSITGNNSNISVNGTSDYRLKEDLKEINGLEKVLAIKVYDFKWKNSENRMDGVIAHELQEVLPYAVQGEKDGKDMQGVDYSKLVPIMVKAIQELKAEIEAQQQQINSLINR